MTAHDLGPAPGDPGGAAVAPIDPFAPAPGGWYLDELVQVRSIGPMRPRGPGSVRTEHFDVRHVGDRVHVDHWLPPTNDSMMPISRPLTTLPTVWPRLDSMNAK